MGTQHWVPYEEATDATEVVRAAKAPGAWIGVLELTTNNVARAASMRPPVRAARPILRATQRLALLSRIGARRRRTF